MGTGRNDEMILYPEYGGDYITARGCQNVENYALKTTNFTACKLCLYKKWENLFKYLNTSKGFVYVSRYIYTYYHIRNQNGKF